MGDTERNREGEEREAEREAPHEEGEREEESRKRLFGPGAVGAWTEEELAHLPPLKAPPELATRDEDDSQVMRRGTVIGGRRKAIGTLRPGQARPYGEWEEEGGGGEEPGGREEERRPER
jgi:hypothetical protein